MYVQVTVAINRFLNFTICSIKPLHLVLNIVFTEVTVFEILPDILPYLMYLYYFIVSLSLSLSNTTVQTSATFFLLSGLTHSWHSLLALCFRWFCAPYDLFHDSIPTFSFHIDQIFQRDNLSGFPNLIQNCSLLSCLYHRVRKIMVSIIIFL